MLSEIYRNLAEEIKHVFADVAYPGDDNLVELYHGGRYCSECAGFASLLKGKHWTELPLEMLVREKTSLWNLRPEAYRVFLPAYLSAALFSPSQVDILTDSLVSTLSPSNNEQTQRLFLARVNGFNSKQKSFIRRFLKLYREAESDDPNDPTLIKAIQFWTHEA